MFPVVVWLPYGQKSVDLENDDIILVTEKEEMTEEMSRTEAERFIQDPGHDEVNTRDIDQSKPSEVVDLMDIDWLEISPG